MIESLAELVLARGGHDMLAPHGRTLQPKPRANAYDATGTGRRLANWNATDAGINELLKASGDVLRARSRDLVRRNGWASHIVDEYVSDLVGTAA